MVCGVPHAGLRPWCHTFRSVLRRPAADHWERGLYMLMTHRSTVPVVHQHTRSCNHVHWSCHGVDAFKSPPAKCGEDWDPLVSYKSSTSPTATSSTPSPYRLRDAVRSSPRPRNSSRLKTCQWVHTPRRQCQPVSLCWDCFVPFDVQCPAPWFNHWWPHLSSVVWTMVTRHWPVFLNIFFGSFSQWWMQLLV